MAAATKYILGGLALGGLAVAGYFTFMAGQGTQTTTQTQTAQVTESAGNDGAQNAAAAPRTEDAADGVSAQCRAFNDYVESEGITVPVREDFTIVSSDESGRVTSVSFKHEIYEDPHGHHDGYDTSTITFDSDHVWHSVEGQKYPYGFTSVWTAEERAAAVRADCLFNSERPSLPAGFHLR